MGLCPKWGFLWMTIILASSTFHRMRRHAKITVRRGLCHKGCSLQSKTSGTAYEKYMCVICGFIYDEALGCPQDGIVPGTRWEDVPDTWCCPDCGASKADVELRED